MGREWYETYPVFRAQVDLCCERLKPDLGLDLRDVLYPAAGADKTEAQHRLMQTSLTQPALFVSSTRWRRFGSPWACGRKS